MRPTLDPDRIATGAVAETRWSPSGRRLAWVRGTRARSELVVDGAVVADARAAGTRGATYAWVDEERVVLVVDHGLRVTSLRRGGGSSEASFLPAEGRASAPAVAPTGLVAFVDETDDECVVAVASLGGDRPRVVVSRAAFAWDPAWSPDGRWLAWHEWDDPAMPWEASRIVVAAADGAGRSVVAGGDAVVGVGQPRFAPGGPARLAFVTDRDGWLNVATAAPDGSGCRVVGEPFEHAEPPWGPGQRSFAWSPDGARLAWCRNEGGFGRLVVAAATDDRAVDHAADHAASSRDRADVAAGRSKGWHRWLDWGHGGLACVRSGARTAPTVTVLGDTGRRDLELAAGSASLPADDFVEPRAVEWRGADAAEVHGLLYSAVPPEGHDGRGPLLVHLHGGPTDQTRVDWDLRFQFWVGQGWTVLAPNARGSTGYGRAYARALDQRWGTVDVDDVVRGIRAAADRGWGDPRRVALVGGSAGAFTALHVAVAAPELVHAVVASYPVTDLAALAAETHRFERHMLDSLVGRPPEAAKRYAERSPITHAASVRAPLLVLQGDADPVVPARHVERFVDAVRGAGGDVQLHVYRDEGHGWTRPETVVDALRRADAFLTQRVLGR